MADPHASKGSSVVLDLGFAGLLRVRASTRVRAALQPLSPALAIDRLTGALPLKGEADNLGAEVQARLVWLIERPDSEKAEELPHPFPVALVPTKTDDNLVGPHESPLNGIGPRPHHGLPLRWPAQPGGEGELGRSRRRVAASDRGTARRRPGGAGARARRRPRLVSCGGRAGARKRCAGLSSYARWCLRAPPGQASWWWSRRATSSSCLVIEDVRHEYAVKGKALGDAVVLPALTLLAPGGQARAQATLGDVRTKWEWFWSERSPGNLSAAPDHAGLVRTRFQGGESLEGISERANGDFVLQDCHGVNPIVQWRSATAGRWLVDCGRFDRRRPCGVPDRRTLR